MTASSLIGRMLELSRCGWAPAEAMDRAVAETKGERSPPAIRKLVEDARATQFIPKFEWPKGEMVVGGRYSGRTIFMEMQLARLRSMGYEIVLEQRINETRIIKGVRDGDVQEFSIETDVRPKLQRLPGPRRSNFEANLDKFLTDYSPLPQSPRAWNYPTP